MENEKDYDKEDDAAARAVKRRWANNESTAEAAEKMMNNFAKEVFRNKEVRNNIAKDCIERINGRKVSPFDPRTLTGKDGNRITANSIREDLPTGYEKLPWEGEE